MTGPYHIWRVAGTVNGDPLAVLVITHTGTDAEPAVVPGMVALLQRGLRGVDPADGPVSIELGVVTLVGELLGPLPETL